MCRRGRAVSTSVTVRSGPLGGGASPDDRSRCRPAIDRDDSTRAVEPPQRRSTETSVRRCLTSDPTGEPPRGAMISTQPRRRICRPMPIRSAMGTNSRASAALRDGARLAPSASDDSSRSHGVVCSRRHRGPDHPGDRRSAVSRHAAGQARCRARVAHRRRPARPHDPRRRRMAAARGHRRDQTRGHGDRAVGRQGRLPVDGPYHFPGQFR